jgi:hypothetical protein
MFLEKLDQDLSCLLILIIWASQLVSWFVLSTHFPKREKQLLCAVKMRMEAYAFLKPKVHDACKDEIISIDVDDCTNLSVGGHEVLLGTLKKVEQKNGVLVTVIVFLLAVLLASHFSRSPENEPNFSLVITLASLFFPTWWAFRGIVQVDQKDFWTLVGTHKITSVAGKFLQRELIRDLMAKECAFRLAFFWTRLVLSIFLFLTVFHAVLDV